MNDDKKEVNPMPKLLELTPEELSAFEPKPKDTRRQELAQQYDQLLADVEPTKWVKVELETGEKKDAVRYSIKRAAQRRGLTTTFRRTRDETIVFCLNNGTEEKVK